MEEIQNVVLNTTTVTVLGESVYSMELTNEGAKMLFVWARAGFQEMSLSEKNEDMEKTLIRIENEIAEKFCLEGERESMELSAKTVKSLLFLLSKRIGLCDKKRNYQTVENGILISEEGVYSIGFFNLETLNRMYALRDEIYLALLGPIEFGE